MFAGLVDGSAAFTLQWATACSVRRLHTMEINMYVPLHGATKKALLPRILSGLEEQRTRFDTKRKANRIWDCRQLIRFRKCDARCKQGTWCHETCWIEQHQIRHLSPLDITQYCSSDIGRKHILSSITEMTALLFMMWASLEASSRASKEGALYRL